ncbi:hypothetical protein HPB49_009065 [Dermacentor silvarum]|uniref:Uncharacterized protein n=1 Tax=Dermacentor silvarum TaxID=543639 RepID=A0ACB8DCM9_DERSI|nr:hypothetical protein HPB49_009065 [Dermacentor silvarum]
MSAIPPQRIRLSPSSVAAAAASSKPVRPTLPLALMRQGSPTQRNVARRASPSPPVCWAHDSVRMKSRQSPDQRISPENKASSAAQGPKGELSLPTPLRTGCRRKSSALPLGRFLLHAPASQRCNRWFEPWLLRLSWPLTASGTVR